MTAPESVRSPAGVVIARWDAVREEARAIRHDVFVIERGVPVELKWDGQDDECWHALAHGTAGRAIAASRLLPGGHIGRMTVRKETRGTGVGVRILEVLTNKAQSLSYPELTLNVRTHAMPLYSCVGFATEGEEFGEVGIPHRTIRRVLTC